MATSPVIETKQACSSSEKDDFSYFDIMVLGRTGQGKSTLANKLLGIDPEYKELLGVPQEERKLLTSVIKQWGYEKEKFYFEIGNENGSVTKTCDVLSNENTMTRVLDTVGFNNMELTQKYGVIKGNVQLFRWILQSQRAHDLRFSRVLYFLPNRGPPERAEGTLQEEIKVMYGYFEQQIFDIMVIIVTNNKRDHYQLAGFSEGDMADTREVFLAAFEAATSTTLPKCPPVVYIPFNEHYQMIMNHVISAEVISDAEMLRFSPEFPKNRNIEGELEHIPISKNRYECTNCTFRIDIENKLEEIPLGQNEIYCSSKCHPFFIQKYSTTYKILGGIGHICTFGIWLFFEGSWPGFTNSKKVCGSCQQPPGSEGCYPVQQSIENNGQTFVVNHLPKN